MCVSFSELPKGYEYMYASQKVYELLNAEELNNKFWVCRSGV